MSNELVIISSLVITLLLLQLILLFRMHSGAKKQNETLPNIAQELKNGVQQMRENMLTTNTEVVDNIRKLYTAVGQMAEVLEKQRVIVDDLKLFHADDVVAGNARVLEQWKAVASEVEKLDFFLNSINRYTRNLNELMLRLDAHEERMGAVEKMGNYFVAALGKLEHYNEAVENARFDMRQSVTQGIEEWNDSLVKMQQHYLTTVEGMLQSYNARMTSIQEQLASDAEQSSSMRRIRQIAEAKKTLERVSDTMNDLLEYSQLQTRYMALLCEKK